MFPPLHSTHFLQSKTSHYSNFKTRCLLSYPHVVIYFGQGHQTGRRVSICGITVFLGLFHRTSSPFIPPSIDWCSRLVKRDRTWESVAWKGTSLKRKHSPNQKRPLDHRLHFTLTFLVILADSLIRSDFHRRSKRRRKQTDGANNNHQI